MLNNIKKLRSKLYLGFFIIPALTLLGISIYSVYSFLRIDRQVGTIYDDRVIPLIQLKTISDSYAVEIVDAINKANAKIITLSEALQIINRSQQQIQEQWTAYLSTDLTVEEQQLISELKELLNQANPEIENLKQILRAQDQTKLTQFDGSLYQVIDPVSNKLQELTDLQLQVAHQEREKAHQILETTLRIFSSLVLVAVLGASPFGYFVSQAIISKLKDTVNLIGVSSREIAAATEEQERIASHQASSVSQTTTTMDELKASSQQSAQQAEAALLAARQVLALVQGDTNGTLSGEKPHTLYELNLPSQLDVGMTTNLRDKVEQIANQILSLSSQVKQIDKIAVLVSNLANQTNMLAINAAVEAVRAGQHGKGFGVVAAEIRKLADQSRESAERINNLVDDIQQSTEATVIATDEGKTTVAKIVQSMNEIVLNSQKITLTAQQQATAIQQVVEAMNNLNASAQETASGIAQTKISTHKLSEAAQSLGTMV